MRVTIPEEARQYIGAFEAETDATVRDCIVDEDEDRLVFVVKAGEMGKAIGPDGQRVQNLEERFNKSVELVEDAPTAEGFVASALEPAAVYNVTISDGEEGTVAFAEVDEEDKGAAIGSGGKNIEMAERLAKRHFDIDEIQLT